MCTSIAMKTNDFYFGRTMDLDFELHTSVVITPPTAIPFTQKQPMKKDSVWLL